MTLRATVQRAWAFLAPSRGPTAENSPGLTQATDWRHLSLVTAPIEELNRNTEAYFLRAGANLMNFVEAVENILSTLRTLAGLVSGDSGLSLRQEFERLLNQSRQMEQWAIASEAAIEEVRVTNLKMQEAFARFRNEVATFRAIGAMARIETARQNEGAGGLNLLADEMKSLSEGAQRKVSALLETAAALQTRMSETLFEIHEEANHELAQLPEVIHELEASIAGFAERQASAFQSSLRLDQGYRQIRDAIEDMIESLQFHDITRQQVEHVIEVLQRLPDAGVPPPREVVLLQSSQLAEASSKFVNSASRIRESLSRFAEQSQAMAAESTGILGYSEEEHSGFFQHLEQSLRRVLSMLQTCGQLEAESSLAFRDLGLAIDGMSDAMDEICDTDLRIHRMALNSTIRAAHLGAGGAALSIIATSMQDLAIRSGNRSIEARERLHAARRAVSQQLPDASAARSATATIAIDELRDASTRGFDLMQDVSRRADRLCREIQAARDEFQVDQVFAAVTREAQCVLNALAETLPSRGVDADSRHLLTAKYTMEAQRRLHAAAIGGGAPAVTAPRETDDPEGLGANVELF